TLTLLSVTDSSAFTVAAPSIGLYTGLEHNIAISNTSGGALGAITWNSAYVLRSALTAPVAGDTVILHFMYDGTNWRETSRLAPTAPLVNLYTAVGTATWTKPTGAVVTEAFVLSGGAGAGSGRRGAVGTVRCGGGGGAGSPLVSRKFVTSDLTSSVTVTVSDGGAGGAAVTADDTNGNN